MFSNSTDGDLFTSNWCARCAHAYEGDQLCDEASVILFGEPAPEFLVRDGLDVTCTRLERRGD